MEGTLYYVYAGSVNGELMYVGVGAGKRSAHLNSGVSSCYKANKAHFEGILIEVAKLCDCETKAQALHYERQIIWALDPPWNIKGTPRHTQNQPVSTATEHGVYFSQNRWRATCRRDGKKRHIGYYKDKTQALRAYNEFVVENGLNKPLNLL